MNKTPIDNNLLHEILKEEEAEGQLTPEILDDIFIDNKISNVITSYSIHYTKLYDGDGRPASMESNTGRTDQSSGKCSAQMALPHEAKHRRT